jgi:2-polyprenyl-3-methyl-5-hydroxy-6-metoxy-1,4-benzoquinol methylase
MLDSQCAIELSCPACGQTATYRYLYYKNGCDILVCRECGLGRAETKAFDPAAYYTDTYFSGGHPDGYADYLGSERVLRREFARSVQFIRQRRPSGRLLEIGCAYGFFLQEARRYFDVSGIELAEDAAAYCRRNCLPVIGGEPSEQTLSALGEMDIIVMLDVIEHLPAPDETLALCARHLRPGGLIVLTTGDFGSAVARWAGPRWRLMTPPQHLWFFSAASIARLSGRLHLHVDHLDHPWKIVPLSLISFQLRRLLKLKSRARRGATRIGVPINLFDAMRVVLRRSTA